MRGAKFYSTVRKEYFFARLYLGRNLRGVLIMMVILRETLKRLAAWRDSEGWLRTLLKKAFGPVQVGNFDRVPKKGDVDTDEAHLTDLNRTWRAMLLEDPWRKRLMTHVSLLLNICGFFFLVIFFSGLYLPAKHWLPTAVIFANALTIPYWLWIGGWYNKIEKRVFEAFKKKSGKHFHLR